MKRKISWEQAITATCNMTKAEEIKLNSAYRKDLKKLVKKYKTIADKKGGQFAASGIRYRFYQTSESVIREML